MQREDFEQQLTALLRDAGPDTVAELTDTAIAYWNGERVVYADVSAEGTGGLAGEFELDARRWTMERLACRLADRPRIERTPRSAGRDINDRRRQIRLFSPAQSGCAGCAR